MKTSRTRMTWIALWHQLAPHHILTTAPIPLGTTHSSILKHRKKSSVSSADNEIAKKTDDKLELLQEDSSAWFGKHVTVDNDQIKFENDVLDERNMVLLNWNTAGKIQVSSTAIPCLFSIFLPEQTSQAGHRSISSITTPRN